LNSREKPTANGLEAEHECTRLRKAFLRRPAEPDYEGQDGAAGSEKNTNRRQNKKSEIAAKKHKREKDTE